MNAFFLAILLWPTCHYECKFVLDNKGFVLKFRTDAQATKASNGMLVAKEVIIKHKGKTYRGVVTSTTIIRKSTRTRFLLDKVMADVRAGFSRSNPIR